MNVLQRDPVVADFGQPLQLLKACHERIQAQCDTLRRLCVHMPVHGSDAQAQQAASNVMRYFDSAGRHHREDEEQDLFPRMIASATGQNAERVALVIGRLKSEHAEIERSWLELREVLEQIAHGGIEPLDEQSVEQFCAMYGAHLAYEEANMISLAEQLLDAEAIAAIGKAMAVRRGLR
ncbi:MAG: hemerythrin domain-containing protein [Burkholderiales bacterium]|nr:hemerythrin domain-containing protein [Burkholderiales bacterium]